jgi:hypothetical protein
VNRLLKHFSLRRIAGTELRVVSDIESGVGSLAEVEEEVIAKYAATPRWRQQVITLFVLKDLEPLVRQLSEGAAGRRSADLSALPPGGLAILGQRPIVNVYDLENPGSCHVFINQRAMEKEGYWDDREAVKGLLAHEHAHPLSECETTRSARRLQADLSSDGVQPLLPSQAQDKEWQTKVDRLLAVVVDKLCLYAPREVFANDVAIESNFTAPLLYLDKKNVLNAAKGVRSKEALRQRLQAEVETASLTPAGADLLLVIADMHGHLDLAMETASFYRQGKVTEAKELEEMLFAEVMPYLEPPVAEAYPRLRDEYVQLPQDASPEELAQLEAALLGILAAVLKQKGLTLEYNLRAVP